MTYKLFLSISFLFILGLVAGCTITDSGRHDDQSDNNPSQINLVGTSWELFAIRKSTLIEGTSFRITFEADQVTGNAGCNQFFGGYQVEADGITFSALGMTEMACMEPEGLMEQERLLLEFLSQVERFELRSDQLFLIRADGEILSFNTAQD